VTKVAWLLNLDADLELATQSTYTPPARVLERLEAMVPLIQGLMRDGDVRVTSSDRLADTPAGRAWCPTPRALRLLSAAGATVPAAPSLEVLRRVNGRRFCAELGQHLSGAAFVDDISSLRRLIATSTATGNWLLKRPHSFAGTARRKVAVGQLSREDEAWAKASLDRDGLQVEPWVQRVGDLAVHGWVSQSGSATLGRACSQVCSSAGVWQRTVVATDELTVDERRQLEREGRRVAEALATAGYVGPFGVDGYRYRCERGIALNPRGEINARYTMGWAIGMCGRRPDLEES